mgnify:CR=1 FL=1
MTLVVKPVHSGTCHCGAVEFQVRLPGGLVNPRRCDCSMCRRKGAIVASVPLADLTIVKGQESLSVYRFNTMTAAHYFCARCGIYTHHQRRSNPTECGFNVGCLQGVNPLTLKDVPVLDGVHHPSDK